ncbi:PREDICTED: opsin-5-like [Gekko japonicus]|uniref:Opsin-5-like n=1 Tax=Gekko japonicus TaxID=146911 RepID=A0ABM1K4A1_GEKJA|nr:PREDICTED: opsin-5-like [Gekko japonicus]
MESHPNTSSQEDSLLHDHQDEDPFKSKLSKEADIVAGFYLLVVGILSTFGNGYVIYMSAQRKKKLRPAEIVTVNLAVCDLGISVAGKPFSIIAFFSHRWIFGWSGCRWYGWTGFFFGIGSLITMTAVSLDRYLKICHLAYAMESERPSTSTPASRPASDIGQPTSKPPASKAQSSASTPLSRVAMLICAGFLIAWIPYAVVSVWSAFGRPNSVPIKVSVIPTLLAKSAAMYNPIIYQVIDCKSACCRPRGLKLMQKKNSMEKSRSHKVGFERRRTGVGDNAMPAFGKNLSNVVKNQNHNRSSGCFFVGSKKRNQGEGHASGLWDSVWVPQQPEMRE